MKDVFDVRDQTQPELADGDAGDQITDAGPQPERLAQRNGDARCAQTDATVDAPGRCRVFYAANIAQSSNNRSTTCR